MNTKSEDSSVGRAPRPRDTEPTKSGQTDLGTVKQNGTEPPSESARVPSLISEGKEASTEGGKVPGNGEENSGVGGSNPSPRTNLHADETPDWLAKDMVLLAHIHGGMHVLEPSAGTGQIVQAIHSWSWAKVTAVELNAERCKILRDTNARVIHGDFLTTQFKDGFDRVVMNPPIKAAQHVQHAANQLVRGGRLIALLHRQAADDIRWGWGEGHVYHLPTETFRFGVKTPIRASIFVWDKT